MFSKTLTPSAVRQEVGFSLSRPETKQLVFCIEGYVTAN